MKIHTVTVTGADDSTPIESLAEIAEEFPFVEFGILLSRRSMGRSRFPSSSWLARLLRETPDEIKLSGHLCGSWVTETLLGAWPHAELYKAFGGESYFTRFGRWQLNTHGEPHQWTQDFLDTLVELS